MAYRDRFRLEPLRVRAELRSGVVADRYLPLDGILLYQAHRDVAGHQTVTLPGQYSAQSGVTLPLSILRPGQRDWYYQCSWAQWPDHAVDAQDHWNKRFDNGLADLIDFRGRRGNVIVGSGPYKAYHHPVYYRAALWIEWFCVGDRDAINHLLSTVTHIGKKTAQGWGRVARWSIDPIGDDYSVWYGQQLMRGVPPMDAPGLTTGVYGIRPSYWNKRNQMLLALP